MTKKERVKAAQTRFVSWREDANEAFKMRFASHRIEVREQAKARWLEILEEGNLIEADLATIDGHEALALRQAVGFLVDNVRNMDRPPRVVIDICRKLAA